MQALVSGRGGTPWWRFALVAFLALLGFVGCNRNPTTPDGPAVGEAAEGHLDGITAETIWGWAWDPDKPDSPIDVEFFDGETKLDTVTADKFREDLLKQKIGNGQHGFSFATPQSLKDGKSHTIRAKFAGADKELIGSLKPFKFP
jgi:hypothetical protein